MYFLLLGMMASAGAAPLSLGAVVGNLVVVTAGNILGGTVLVALVYWSVYLRHETPQTEGVRES